MPTENNPSLQDADRNADHYRHCLQFLRDADHDRYLAVLYAPEQKRAALAGLYGFNAEIARIRDVVHDALPGEVRLQWWRDMINGTEHGAVTGNPVAALLLQAIETYDLPRHSLDNYCEARIFDLYNDPMPSRNDLEGYCGETASTILQLAAMILDGDAAKDSADLAGHAGVAQGVTGILRLLPLHRARGQIYVPQDILQAVGVTETDLIKGNDPAALERVVSALCALAQEHYAAFAAQPLPQQLKPAFLPVMLVPRFLQLAKRNGADTAINGLDVTHLRRQWIYLRKSLFS